MRIMCRLTLVQRFITVSAIILLATVAIQAQSTRPRRTGRQSSQPATKTPADDPLLRPEPQPSPTARRTSSNDSLLDVQPVRPVEHRSFGRHETRVSPTRTKTVCRRREGGKGTHGVVPERSGGVEDCGLRRV